MSGGVTGFAARYKRAWHVTEAEGAGCEILYPAAALLRLAGLAEACADRDDFEFLTLPDGKVAVLRPQLMPDQRLRPTLAGRFAARPDLWRDHINRHVFFFVSEDRRDRFMNACIRLRRRGAMPGISAPVAITVDTAALLEAHHDVAYFSRINTGSTVRGGARARRDENTLGPVHDWRRHDVAELAIRGPVRLSPCIIRGAEAEVASNAERLTRPARLIHDVRD